MSDLDVSEDLLFSKQGREEYHSNCRDKKFLKCFSRDV